MPVSFPTNPTVGQTYTFGGVTWQWNGTTWVNAASGTAFVPTTGHVTVTGPLTVAGVTDGSDAPAGDVGEFLTITATSANPGGGGAWATLANLPLTAGDWDCWGVGSYTTTAAGFLTFAIGTVIPPTAAGLNAPTGYAASNIAGSIIWAIPAIRLSINTAQSLLGGVNNQGGGGTSVTIVLFARRVR